MSSADEQYTLQQIAGAPLRELPFAHVLVRDVFEPDLYRRMLDHLLPERLMQPIKDVRPVKRGYPDERFVFPLTPDGISSLPARYREFWQALGAWLLAPAFAVTLFNKFGAHIYRRFGEKQPPFYNEAMLVDDRTRYVLGPH